MTPDTKRRFIVKNSNSFQFKLLKDIYVCIYRETNTVYRNTVLPGNSAKTRR